MQYNTVYTRIQKTSATMKSMKIYLAFVVDW